MNPTLHFNIINATAGKLRIQSYRHDKCYLLCEYGCSFCFRDDKCNKKIFAYFLVMDSVSFLHVVVLHLSHFLDFVRTPDGLDV